MDKCSKCKYRKSCEQLNYLDVANTCSDLRKFVDDIRAEVIEEIKKKVHPCDNCNMCKTQKEFEYNYEKCVYDEEVKLTKIFEILGQLKENK